MTNRYSLKPLAPSVHRETVRRGLTACFFALSTSVAVAAPTVEFTSPQDLTYPADNASATAHPLIPAQILDIKTELAPGGVEVETIPESGLSILNPPDVVTLTPTGQMGPLGPGSYTVNWNATTPDTPAGGIDATQTITVLPHANFGAEQLIRPERTYRATVELNVPALPGKPVEIPFTVGGTANQVDHSARDDVIIIPPGETSGSYQFEVFGGETGSQIAGKTVTFTLAPPLTNAVAGYDKQVFRVLVGNQPANAEISATQGGRTTRTITRDGGLVTMKAVVQDSTPTTPASITWSSTETSIVPPEEDTGTTDSAGNPIFALPAFTLPPYLDSDGNIQEVSHSYTFDPSALTADRFYTIEAEINEGKSSVNRFVFRVIDTAPTFTNADSDGDEISDDIEGLGDTDNDGIADYLDAVPQANLIQATPLPDSFVNADNNGQVAQGSTVVEWTLTSGTLANNKIPYTDLIATEPGLKASIGTLAFAADTDLTDQINHARIPISSLEGLIADLPAKGLNIIQGLPYEAQGYTGLEESIFSVEISGISPNTNQRSAYFVVPLQTPISNSDTGELVLNVITDKGFRETFDLDSPENQYYTAYRNAKGYCPEPGSPAYLNGFTHGHDCLQLLVEENSIYDADGTHNGRIQFIGGLFRPRLSNCQCAITTSQIASADTAAQYGSAPDTNLFSLDGLVTQTTIVIPAGKTDSLNFIVPLTSPIPPSGSGPLTFYLLDSAGNWRPFTTNGEERIASAQRNGEGFCPSPDETVNGNAAYVEGLNQGAECLQLTVVNDGANDRDTTTPDTIEIVGSIYAPGLLDNVPPSITLPTLLDISSNAPVQLIDFATVIDDAGSGFVISDAISGSTTIRPASENEKMGPFPPGRHTIRWEVTDLGYNSAVGTQTFDVLPQVNLAIDQTVVDNTTVTVSAYLNGPAISGKAVSVPLTLSDSVNITPSDSTIVINEGERVGSIELVIGEKTAAAPVVVTLDLVEAGLDTTRVVAGDKTRHTLTILDNRDDNNRPPVASLALSQGGQITHAIINNDGTATISSSVTDTTPRSSPMTYLWDNPYAELQPLTGTNGPNFSFDPATLADGIYTLGLTVGDGLDSSRVDITFSINSTIPSNLSSATDTDDDGLNDAAEGAGDADNDGISNDVDAVDNAEWLQAWPNKTFDEGLSRSDSFQSDNFKVNWSIDTLASNTVAYPLLLTADPGVKLSLGPTAFVSGFNQARIPIDEALVLLGQSYPGNIGSADGYVVDVEISQLPTAGQSVTLNIPQTAPLPPGGTLTVEMFKQGSWTAFTTTATDSYATAPRVTPAGGKYDYCPRYGYSAGLTTGHECLQITLRDGGVNDSDGVANGTIRFLGGVFTTLITEPAETPPPYPSGFNTDADEISGQRNDGGAGGGGPLGWSLLALLSIVLLKHRKSGHGRG